MARFLTQTLTLLPKSKTLTLIPSLLTPSRPKSNRAHNPDGPAFIEIDIGSGSETDIQMVTKKIEDAIHSIYAQRSAPDWLPFRPGSSYWVPPPWSGKRADFKAVDLVRMVKTTAGMHGLSSEEEMALLTTRGWPSISFFVEDNETKEKIGGGKIANVLFYLDVPTLASVAVSTTCWHQRLGHPPPSMLRLMLPDLPLDQFTYPF